MQKEYWVNVYEWGYGHPNSSHAEAQVIAFMADVAPIYRIHVKMKPKSIDWSLQPQDIYERYMWGKK